MEPGLPTSFIPKRPVSTEPVATSKKSRTVGLLSLAAVVFMLATIVAFVGVYLYGQQLNSRKVKLEQAIASARDGLGTDFVADMKRLNARIDGVKTILKNHVVVTPVFDALQKTTLRSVQYERFTYTLGVDPVTKDSVVQVELMGTAVSYATIALQSDAFVQNQIIRNPVFSNLTIDEDTDRVDFRLKFNVSPEDLSYNSLINGETPQ